MIETMDPTTWITDQGDGFICYENADGKKWTIFGQCNSCGACEPEFALPGETTTTINVILINGEKQDYTRTLLWLKSPGEPGACSEVDFHQRKDVPITPDLISKTPSCVFSGEWD
jgi:hypothetical protein